jgi:hypothetical protein
MSRKTIYLLGAIPILVLAAIWIQPAVGDLVAQPDPGGPASSVAPPPEPAPEPGRTELPPGPSADEDAYVPATAAEQRELLRRLREVVGCARERGARVPDPVAVDVGALIPWSDGEPDHATSKTLEGCFEPRGN